MKNRISRFTVLAGTAFLLGACVPAQDLTSLDLRIRNLDNKVVRLNEAVKRLDGGGKDSPLEALRLKQAELGDSLDQLNMDILQIKAQLEENRHFYKSLQQNNDKTRADLQQRLDALAEQFVVLADQLRQTSAGMEALQKSNETAMARARAAEERARVAQQAAAEAKKARLAAAAAARKNKKGPKELVAAKKKISPNEKKAKSVAAGGGSGPGKEIYDKALALFRKGKFSEAYREFTRYIEKHPTGKMAPNARFWLGDCYYAQEEYELAILEYQKVIADFATHPKAPAALLKQGLAFERLKDTDTAVIVYKKLLADYPKSEQAKTAKGRLAALGSG